MNRKHMNDWPRWFLGGQVGWCRSLIGLLCATLTIVTSHTTYAASPAAQVQPYRLRSTDGKIVTDRSYVGKVQVVFFGFTSCPDVCPTTMASMAQALKIIGTRRQQVQVIFIGVDHYRDDMKTLKAYVRAFGPDIVGLTGDEKSLAQAARAFRATYKVTRAPGGEVNVSHSGVVYIVDKGGRIAGSLPHHLKPQRFAEALNKVLDRPAHPQKARSPGVVNGS